MIHCIHFNGLRQFPIKRLLLHLFPYHYIIWIHTFWKTRVEIWNESSSYLHTIPHLNVVNSTRMVLLTLSDIKAWKTYIRQILKALQSINQSTHNKRIDVGELLTYNTYIHKKGDRGRVIGILSLQWSLVNLLIVT